MDFVWIGFKLWLGAAIGGLLVCIAIFLLAFALKWVLKRGFKWNIF